MSRSSRRNIRFYDATNPATPLGGLRQHGSVTERNFLDMLEILIVTQVGYRVERRQDQHIVTRSDHQLRHGDYDIYCDEDINVNDEAWVPRITTRSNSARDSKFRDAVRSRDGKCVFSGLINEGAQDGLWYGFQAAHIFPLSAGNVWDQNSFGRWITHTAPGQSKINSVQNGFLIQGSLHQAWDSYAMSVDPNIVVFLNNTWRLDGRTLDPVCRDPQDPRHVSDELLRWHFRQCVFANMRGAGEPVFEPDYPPGSDIMGELREAPLGREQFELMLVDRLRGFATE